MFNVQSPETESPKTPITTISPGPEVLYNNSNHPRTRRPMLSLIRTLNYIRNCCLTKGFPPVDYLLQPTAESSQHMGRRNWDKAAKNVMHNAEGVNSGSEVHENPDFDYHVPFNRI